MPAGAGGAVGDIRGVDEGLAAVGREETIGQAMRAGSLGSADGLEIHNARLSRDNKRYTDFLYARLQRKGALYRDCQRMVNQNRNVFAACMVALGDADAVVSGLTRSFSSTLDDIRRVVDARPGHRLFGLSIFAARGRVNIETLAASLGRSRRQLERVFEREVGLAPKFLARIARFQHAYGLARGEAPDWSAVAAEAGYADQAHLIRDFRAFADTTPVSLCTSAAALTETFARRD